MTSSLIFSEIAELRNEKVNPESVSGSRYIGLEHIEQNSLSLSGWGIAEDVDSQKQRFYEGDILFGKLRPYFRKVAIAPFDGICSTDIWVVRPVVKTDRDFLFYWMASEDFIARATNAAEGTRMPRAKWDWVSRFELPFMSPINRQRTGAILRSLDDKIAHNRELSQTMEEIAQTLFRSWFVDFDPVKAKMAGERPVGMDDATAALFPDSMEDSELGPVPTNWRPVPLTDLFDVLSGGTPKTTEGSYWGGSIPWFSVVDAPVSGGSFFIKTEKTITEIGVSKSAAKIVRPGVTIISARGTVGKTAIVASPSTFNQSCYGLMGKYGDFYTYLLVKYMVAKLQNIAHGGMFDTITRKTFSALTVPKPMEPVINAFEKLVEPMFMQIKNLQYQNEQLATMRDAILPRLISGELQIPEEMLVS